jgi:hypothetical protein
VTVLFVLVQFDSGGSVPPNYASAKISVGISLENLVPSAGGTTRASRQVNITPTEYEMAIVNFWLLKDNGDEVNIINPDSASPVYASFYNYC